MEMVLIMKKNTWKMISLVMVIGISVIGVDVASADEATPQKSKADFSITAKDTENPTDPDNGTLTLKEVHSFNYGVIEASEIYSGFANRQATAEGSVIVSDTRLGVSDWVLSADMAQFTNDKTTLEGAALNLSADGTLGETLSGVVKDDSSPVELVNGNGSHGKNIFIVAKEKAQLTLGANPKAVLENEDVFQTTINWNLSSTQPVAPTA